MIKAVPAGKKMLRERERVDLIVMMDEEYNILMKMEILPVEQLRALLGKAVEVGLTTLAAKIRKEIGEDELPDPQPAA